MENWARSFLINASPPPSSAKTSRAIPHSCHRGFGTLMELREFESVSMSPIRPAINFIIARPSLTKNIRLARNYALFRWILYLEKQTHAPPASNKNPATSFNSNSHTEATSAGGTNDSARASTVTSRPEAPLIR